MVEDNKSLDQIKNAAKAFVRTLQNSSPKSEVAVSWYRGHEGENPTVTNGSFQTLENNYQNILNAIDASGNANGGTPMGAALQKANDRLNDAKYTNKYVILFTDGMPGYSSSSTNWNCMVANNAYNYATEIKKKATLFTVGYSLDGNFKWEPGHSSTSSSDRNHKKHRTTTSATQFLEKYIATTATNGKQYAYTTDNSAGLQATFENLAGSIGSLYSIQPERIVDVKMQRNRFLKRLNCREIRKKFS